MYEDGDGEWLSLVDLNKVLEGHQFESLCKKPFLKEVIFNHTHDMKVMEFLKEEEEEEEEKLKKKVKHLYADPIIMSDKAFNPSSIIPLRV